MCMRNVNATMLLFSEVGMQDGHVDSLNALFDSAIPVKEDESYYLNNFNLFLNMSIIFDDSTKIDEKCIQLNQTYEVVIRLVHVESGKGISLYNFDLCLTENDLTTWCKDFYESKKIIQTKKLNIPKGLGNYALKLLIRTKTDDKEKPWFTQTIHKLTVGDSR